MSINRHKNLINTLGLDSTLFRAESYNTFYLFLLSKLYVEKISQTDFLLDRTQCKDLEELFRIIAELWDALFDGLIGTLLAKNMLYAPEACRSPLFRDAIKNLDGITFLSYKKLRINTEERNMRIIEIIATQFDNPNNTHTHRLDWEVLASLDGANIETHFYRLRLRDSNQRPVVNFPDADLKLIKPVQAPSGEDLRFVHNQIMNTLAPLMTETASVPNSAESKAPQAKDKEHHGND